MAVSCITHFVRACNARCSVVTDSSVIGAGAGSAGVFQAQNNETGETVAIKMIDRSREGASVIAGQRLIADPARRHTVDASWKHSLQRELDIAIKLVHPNIIELKDVVFQDRYVCLVMEHARGGELFQKVAKYGAMTEDLARVYFRQIVAAVIYCHSTGICHRDLKLENCLLAEEGSHLVKIADFGEHSVWCERYRRDIATQLPYCRAVERCRTTQSTENKASGHSQLHGTRSCSCNRDGAI